MRFISAGSHPLRPLPLRSAPPSASPQLQRWSGRLMAACDVRLRGSLQVQMLDSNVAVAVDGRGRCLLSRPVATVPLCRLRCSSSLHQRCTSSAGSIRMRRLCMFVSLCVCECRLRRSLLLCSRVAQSPVASRPTVPVHAGRLAVSCRLADAAPTDNDRETNRDQRTDRGADGGEGEEREGEGEEGRSIDG